MSSELNWDEIADDLGVRLYAYFKRRNAKEASSDLTQETLIRLYNKVEEGAFDPKIGNISQYAFGIASYVILEHQKSFKESVQIDDSTYSFNVLDQQLEKAQKQKIVRQAIAELPLIQQEVLALAMDDELTLKQISEILQQPENTIKSHIHRAKENLRTKLQLIWSQL